MTTIYTPRYKCFKYETLSVKRFHFVDTEKRDILGHFLKIRSKYLIFIDSNRKKSKLFNGIYSYSIAHFVLAQKCAV